MRFIVCALENAGKLEKRYFLVMLQNMMKKGTKRITANTVVMSLRGVYFVTLKVAKGVITVMSLEMANAMQYHVPQTVRHVCRRSARRAKAATFCKTVSASSNPPVRQTVRNATIRASARNAKAGMF